MDDVDIAEARAKMIEKRFGNGQGARFAGMRRSRNPASSKLGDDKKLGIFLRKNQFKSLPNMEEANIFLNNGQVIHIMSPKVMVGPPVLHTTVLSGPSTVEKITSLLPGILNQLGENMSEAYSKELRSYSDKEYGNSKQFGTAAGDGEEEEDDDDDVPELVENFEEASMK
jgi:nascent polypeptide-associated complex subunit beta